MTLSQARKVLSDKINGKTLKKDHAADAIIANLKSTNKDILLALNYLYNG